ncbi:BMP family lipoprotein [Actinoalloteichus spitiensis]|uniref:BMP family lipoprotein n=1 Tax=Actinoalloteichus spitiensis TaxID=252394 RepID=UPI000373971B|nr:BMP family ABC transporter substrate-binding protein [Actinoalloteichus spitiensis]
MRRPRGAALAIALTGVLAVVGCAKDGGGTSTSGEGAGGEGAAGCQLADPPPAPDEVEVSTPETADVDGSELRVGLAYDIGGRGDASFNDAAAAGLDRAEEEFGLGDVRELTAEANESEDAKVSRLRQLADEGFSPIIGVGFAYADAFETVAADYPDTDFALVDAAVEDADNITPLLFAEHEGSFLAGVAAAYKSDNCHVGFVGGVETPLIQKFEAGFLEGARAAAPDIQIENTYLTPAGDITGFQDPAKGNEATRAQIDAGADVVYHAAGASGKGVFEAAKAGDALAIGVDSDQYNQETVAESKDVIITSMLKRVDVAVFNYLAAVAEDDLTDFPEVFDLSVDGVDYSTSGGMVDDIADVLDGYKAQIIAGDIEVPSSPTG